MVAFDAGNLLAVGKAIQTDYPKVRIIFAADNDPTKGNPGVTKAMEAAKAVGGIYTFPAEWADFNDVYVKGPEAVRQELGRASWELSAILRRALRVFNIGD